MSSLLTAMQIGPVAKRPESRRPGVLIALSSGESELYAAFKAAAETLGLMSMLKDLHWEMDGKIYGDASAALSLFHRPM